MVNGMRLKKWFMLQVWRFQQISQVATLILLSANLAAIVWNLMKNTSFKGTIFSTSWVGIPAIMVIIGLVLWIFAIYWDLRLKMWRDQATVLMERNPYVKEKMTPKEIALYGLTYLPLLEHLGKTDPKAKEAAEGMAVWLRKCVESDPQLDADVHDLMRHINKDRSVLLDYEKKPGNP